MSDCTPLFFFKIATDSYNKVVISERHLLKLFFYNSFAYNIQFSTELSCPLVPMLATLCYKLRIIFLKVLKFPPWFKCSVFSSIVSCFYILLIIHCVQLCFVFECHYFRFYWIQSLPVLIFHKYCNWVTLMTNLGAVDRLIFIGWMMVIHSINLRWWIYQINSVFS